MLLERRTCSGSACKQEHVAFVVKSIKHWLIWFGAVACVMVVSGSVGVMVTRVVVFLS